MQLYFSLIMVVIFCDVSYSTDPYILRTKSLPTDMNFMPSLSNGHLGYTIFGDSIFMNGVYNGAGGNSRRARIPNWINITAEICDRKGYKIINKTSEVNYELSLRGGYFKYTESYADLGITLEQRTYPHKYFNRGLVYELLAYRHTTVSPTFDFQYIKLTTYPGNDSKAFDFVVLKTDTFTSEDYYVLRGHTKVVEQPRFQRNPHEVFVVFSKPFQQSRMLIWHRSVHHLQHRVIVCIDRQQSVARKELQDMLQKSFDGLLQSHVRAWTDFWTEKFSIEIIGNDLELSRIVNAGIFFLASSLPALKTNHENEPYYGLSPSGLPRGDLDSDYEGHSFWDTEIWMLPVVTQFGFEYAKYLLNYRFTHMAGAKYNAELMNNKGARYPWESAYTGTEVINPCCKEIAQQEIHISPDISFGLQKFFAQSNDYVFLCERAWPIASEVAEFLVSRSTCEQNTQDTQSCHFFNVMGPDEDHSNVNDNVYTNAVSKIALDFAIWATDMCGNPNSASVVNWTILRDQLVILYDRELNYHPQHSGYQLNEMVKQADTILLGYPLRFDSSSTHLNDLHYYANVTRMGGPAMTWSMFAANYVSSLEYWRADKYFLRGYQQYVHPEFKVWSEVTFGYQGSTNFLTGIGGFLQSLIFGYGGLDFARIGNSSRMLLSTPNIPPNVERVCVKYIRFAHCKCSWTFQYKSSIMHCTGPTNQRFELVQGKLHIPLTLNFNVTLRRGDLPIYITALNST